MACTSMARAMLASCSLGTAERERRSLKGQILTILPRLGFPNTPLMPLGLANIPSVEIMTGLNNFNNIIIFV
jgi:hypothetical protein